MALHLDGAERTDLLADELGALLADPFAAREWLGV
jgi:hypothetical protein